MKKIQIIQLTSPGKLGYIVEVYDISLDPLPHLFSQRFFYTGYIVDSNNDYMPTGSDICFTITKINDNLISENNKWYSRYDIELLDIIEQPNWFEKLCKQFKTLK